jgi:hypothetical protein
LRDRTNDLVAATMNETGASEAWSRFNIHLTEGIMREAAAATTRVAGEVLATDKPGCLSLAARQPIGVCLAIAPWNAPLILGMRSIIWPLACGNSVVLKASELCPGTHQLLGEILVSAGFPKGTVNVVMNAPEDAASIVSTLIAHKAVRHINFTGSSRNRGCRGDAASLTRGNIRLRDARALSRASSSLMRPRRGWPLSQIRTPFQLVKYLKRARLCATSMRLHSFLIHLYKTEYAHSHAQLANKNGCIETAAFGYPRERLF